MLYPNNNFIHALDGHIEVGDSVTGQFDLGKSSLAQGLCQFEMGLQLAEDGLMLFVLLVHKQFVRVVRRLCNAKFVKCDNF